MKNKPSRRKNAIDCMKMKERIQSAMHRATRTMTVRQKLAYIRQRAANGPLAAWWQQALQRQHRRRTTG